MIQTVRKITDGELMAQLEPDEVLKWMFTFDDDSKPKPEKNYIVCPNNHKIRFDFQEEFYPGNVLIWRCDKCNHPVIRFSPFAVKLRELC